jgi:hypothetical protein
MTNHFLRPPPKRGEILSDQITAQSESPKATIDESKPEGAKLTKLVTISLVRYGMSPLLLNFLALLRLLLRLLLLLPLLQ